MASASLGKPELRRSTPGTIGSPLRCSIRLPLVATSLLRITTMWVAQLVKIVYLKTQEEVLSRRINRQDFDIEPNHSDIMAIVFVHGVNTREENIGWKDLEYFLRHYIAPQIAGDTKKVIIEQAYWGDLGMKRAQKSNPASREYQSSDDIEKAETIISLRENLYQFPGKDPKNHETLGNESFSRTIVLLQNLDTETLTHFLITAAGTVADGENLGAIGAIIIYDLVREGEFRRRLKQCSTFDQELTFVEKELTSRFKTLSDASPIENLGSALLFPSAISKSVNALVNKLYSASAPAMKHVLDDWRRHLHDFTTNFFGDVLLYLNTRGTQEAPSKITMRVMQTILDVSKRSPKNEKLVLLSHSMGGQIVFDILSFFAMAVPDFPKVDFWCATASQVGYFLEMELFMYQKAHSNTNLPLSPALNKRYCSQLWNVWDGSDFISYSATGLLSGVDEFEFRSRLPPWIAHGAYLKSPVFFQAFADRLCRHGNKN